MKLQRVVFVWIGMMLLFAAKSPAQQVKTDYDRGANFVQYKTYSWEHTLGSQSHLASHQFDTLGRVPSRR